MLSVSSVMYRERPDSKEGRISLPWLKFRLIFQRAGSLMVFLELQWEAGVCFRVMAGVDIKNFCLFSDVRTPI